MIPGVERTEMREPEHGALDPPESFNPDKRVEVQSENRQRSEAYNPDKRLEVFYTIREERMLFATYTDGTWSGEPGNSRIRPNVESLPGKAAHEKLQEFNLDEIEYKDGVVDFSACSYESVKIDHMTSSIEGNRRQALRAVAEKWNAEGRVQDGGARWTANTVRDWASKNGLSFHECSDMKTCQFVPKEIHSYFKHYGGRAECKIRDMQANGGGFDE